MGGVGTTCTACTEVEAATSDEVVELNDNEN